RFHEYLEGRSINFDEDNLHLCSYCTGLFYDLKSLVKSSLMATSLIDSSSTSAVDASLMDSSLTSSTGASSMGIIDANDDVLTL
ncbi:unnamed protein product, partial [Rotaria sp. Silwood2]